LKGHYKFTKTPFSSLKVHPLTFKWLRLEEVVPEEEVDKGHHLPLSGYFPK
jgi:hypothetical protein